MLLEIIMNRKIDVDNEVFEFLKKNAEPFIDTPNSVLRKLLFKNKYSRENEILKNQLSFPLDMPAKLIHTLEVIYFIKIRSQSRNEATYSVAKKYGVAYQTIVDKYCRQLNKTAYDIDMLLLESDLKGFQNLLRVNFPKYIDFIEKFFKQF